MDLLKTLLEQSPIMALFLAIAVGYAVGEINLKGFSLGVGAVLFVGLAIGAFAPKSVPPALLGSLGLIMFLYGIGIQYGKQFFAGMAGPTGRRYNLLAVIGILAAFGVAWLAMKFLNIKTAYVAGLYSGALTNTPALQAALEIAGNNDPAVGYSVAYPFGIIVSILGIYVAAIVLKPKVEAPPKKGLELVELVIRNAAVIGKRLEDVETMLPSQDRGGCGPAESCDPDRQAWTWSWKRATRCSSSGQTRRPWKPRKTCSGRWVRRAFSTTVRISNTSGSMLRSGPSWDRGFRISRYPLNRPTGS